MDLALYGFIVLLFAVWCTVHLALSIELLKKDWRRGLGGFIVFPLAPYFASNLRIKKYPALWVTSALLYFVALIFGSL